MHVWFASTLSLHQAGDRPGKAQQQMNVTEGQERDNMASSQQQVPKFLPNSFANCASAVLLNSYFTVHVLE
jgi:hypothetical protein